ncbi:MAG: hypothetical protein HYU68_03460 [Bacteroidetes bacterium]|nr:hypothetical protein [Bacteroidota bacterium]
MKKYIITLIVSVLTISSFAQTVNKKYPYKDKRRDYFYYKISYPVNNKEILSIFTFKDVITLRLYDAQLNQIAEKNIARQSKGDYSTDYYLSNKYLFIIEEIKKEKVTTRVSLDENFKSMNFAGAKKPYFYVDISNNNYYYGASKGNTYFNRVNFNTKNTVDYSTNLNEGEKVSVTEFSSFKTSELMAVSRTKEVNKKQGHEVALHDTTGKELTAFSRLENNIFKSTVGFSNIDDVIYTVGNYKEAPKNDEIRDTEDHSSKPKYTGIYLKNMNAKNPIEKYYKFSDFKNFNNQMEIDKRVNEIDKYRFRLENIVSNKNEMIVIGTIDKDAFTDSYDILDKRYETVYNGQELTYILIFGINNTGDILWDQVITLDWKDHPKHEQTSSCIVNNFPKTVTVKKEANKIECHYSFGKNIFYFEIENGQLINRKKTPYISRSGETGLVEFQFKSSIYWYDNFYFNEDGVGESLLLDKIEFDK